MKKTDTEILWVKIEQDYRTGVMKDRALARHYGVPPSTLRGRIKREGWKRDLRERTKKELRRQLIAQDGAPSSRVSESRPQDTDKELDDQTVKKAVEKGVKIINKHRRVVVSSFAGSAGLQKLINKKLADTKRLKSPIGIDDLKALTQAQKQLSHSILNLINADRRSYDLDDVKDESMPDAITITFHRDKGDIKDGQSY